MNVSIILPAYNEAQNLRLLLPRICEKMHGVNFEVIVVDDNSPDNTTEIIDELISTGLPIKLVVRKKNRGFANSIREGIESSGGDFIVVMDSDGNHNPAYLPFMCAATKFYPCIVASRFQYGGGMASQSRQGLSWIFNIFVRATTGGYVTDSLFGFFIIQREALLKVNFDKVFWGYGDYCIRLLFYLQKQNLSILQFPAKNGERLHGQGNSKFIRVFWQYFTECLKLVFRERVLSGKSN